MPTLPLPRYIAKREKDELSRTHLYTHIRAREIERRNADRCRHCSADLLCAHPSDTTCARDVVVVSACHSRVSVYVCIRVYTVPVRRIPAFDSLSPYLSRSFAVSYKCAHGEFAMRAREGDMRSCFSGVCAHEVGIERWNLVVLFLGSSEWNASILEVD